MLRRLFDPKQPYRAAVYLRFSSDQQNVRSPEQQLAEIKRRLKSQGCKWQIVKSYRDDAISGRLLRKRVGYQQMIREIKTGAIKIDLILVDTIERFGRVEGLRGIRKDLFEKDGVLVLAADTNFVDPTTPQGRALGMFEEMRSTEHGRILGHNVLRGKRDAAQQGHWPGGPPPFGYMLQSVMKEEKGRQVVDYCLLVRNPKTDWIMATLLHRARDTGEGQTKLARFLNAHPDIPKKYKPFQPPTVGYWLDNPIYSGELVWEKNCTGIVDDMRVVERNNEEDVTRVPDFCEPIVTREVQEAIWAVRRARRDRIVHARKNKAENGGKLIEPPAPGLTLKYLLTGLVRCGHCSRAMNPVSTRAYVTKSGKSNRYTAYSCPGYVAGVCPNHKRIPEDWLRQIVVGKMRERLFPMSKDVESLEWLRPLVEEVRAELASCATNEPDQQATLQQELKDLAAKQTGWSISLAKADLSPTLRTAIEADWEAAVVRQQEIERLLAEHEHHQEHLAEIVDPEQVVDRLNRLPEILALNNPTLGNLELSLHIDRIDCLDDGKVIMRTCKLGALAGAADLLAVDTSPAMAEEADGNGTLRAAPRRRTRLRVDAGPDGGVDLRAAADTAADPHRFASLDERWFWEDVFHVPEKTCWAKDHAAEVAQLRAAELTMEKLALHFGKTVPTIRSALRYAAYADESVAQLPRKMLRRRWHEDHAAEVAAKKAENLGTDELAAYFGKSDTTIRAALNHARQSPEQVARTNEAADNSGGDHVNGEE
jgi:DNA invertase Pin-like site-specific DNA recombinase